MLAVFERIDLSLLETILAAAAGESSLQMVTFTNQPPGRGHSVPDARISARFAYWFEVKTARNALDAVQLKEHCANLGTDGGDERLFAISPDPEQPRAVTDILDPRIVWFNFRALNDAIDVALADPEAASEQARFLLRELQALLLDEGVVLDSDDVVIVAAHFAYPEYLKHGAYVCQAERAFREGITHLGFYADGAIQTYVPWIRHPEDHVTFTREEAARRRAGSDTDRRIADVIEDSLTEGREDGQQYKVLLLSGHEEKDTVKLSQPIFNDTVTKSGRACAWTQRQRYVSLSGLTAPGVTHTSDLHPRQSAILG